MRAASPATVAAAVLAASLAPSCGEEAATVRSKPARSYLVLVVDSLRADHMGTYGYERPTTPRLDELAAAGLVFEHAVAQAPWTKPSVASLFTSTYPSVHATVRARRVVDGRKVADVLGEEFVTFAEAMSEAGFATAGFGSKLHLEPGFGFAQGFDTYDMGLAKAPGINRALLGWLDEDEPERFFVYVHYNGPHHPYLPDEDFAAFGNEMPDEPVNDPRMVDKLQAHEVTLSDEDVRRIVDLYDGEILYEDHHIGALLQALEDRGYGNVLVVLTADHGEEFNDHGSYIHGQSLYDELVRVPLIVGGTALPEGARGRRVDAPVELIDLMPTFLELEGREPPAGVQGRSFAALIRDASTPGPRFGYSQKRRQQHGGLWDTVLDGRWKLMRKRNGDVRLFDLDEDPGEQRSVADEHPDVVAAMSAELDRWTEANKGLRALRSERVELTVDPELEQQLREIGYVDF